MGNLQTAYDNSLHSTPKHINDKAQPLEQYEEIIDERMEILNLILGCDISSVIMLYLNAIHTMLSQRFMIEMRWSIDRNFDRGTRDIGCKIYFNRTDEILSINDNRRNRVRLPFECIVEVTGIAGYSNLFENYQCTATISSIFIDRNAKLNIQQIITSKKHSKKKQKINHSKLMECIVITLNQFTPNIKSNKLMFERFWKYKLLIASTALSRYLETNKYGPMLYAKDGDYCNIIFTKL